MSARHLFTLVSALCLWPSGSALAQFRVAEIDSGRARLEVQSETPGRPDLRRQNQDMPLARQLLRIQQQMNRNPDLALARLEALDSEHPQNHQLRLQLGRAYRLTGDLVRSEEVLRALLREFPASTGYRGELIQTLFRAGKDSEASFLLRGIHDRKPPSAGKYEEAASILMAANRMRMVTEVYREGLEVLPASDERGRLRLIRRLYELYNLENDPVSILRLMAEERLKFGDSNLRRRLLDSAGSLLAEAEGPERLVPMADSLAAAADGHELAEILREIYLAVRHYERFAEQVLLAPVDTRLRGDWLHDEGLRCLNHRRGQSESRRRAAARLFTAGLEAPNLSGALRSKLRFQLARIRLNEDADARLRGEVPSDEEVSALRGHLRAMRLENPTSQWATQSLIEELRYLRVRLGAASVADSLLRSWLLEPERARGLEIEAALELELGENLLAARRFDDARGHYESILAASRSRSARNWAGFRLANLLALDGDKQAAQDSLAALAKAEPAGALANDALDLALLLAEASTWPETVVAFLDGSLALECAGDFVGAADRLLAFAVKFPEDPASPALLYRAGLLYLGALRGPVALEAWLLLADKHPDHFRAPQALEQAARLSFRIGDRARARELLERILVEHPTFPLRPSLRDLQDSLEEDA